MPLYFLLLDADTLHRQIGPALGECWRQRSFAPCQSLCAGLAPTALAFRQRFRLNANELLSGQIAGGLPFDRALWRHLAGEILWLSAADIPEIETTADSVACLQGVSGHNMQRPQLAPIQQVYYGSRDLVFGTAYYRPAEAGYNDRDDVGRLADYLAALEPASWSPTTLAALPGLADATDQAEELELVKEWLPPLQDLYRRAQRQGQIVVCETVSA